MQCDRCCGHNFDPKNPSKQKAEPYTNNKFLESTELKKQEWNSVIHGTYMEYLVGLRLAHEAVFILLNAQAHQWIAEYSEAHWNQRVIYKKFWVMFYASWLQWTVLGRCSAEITAKL